MFANSQVFSVYLLGFVIFILVLFTKPVLFFYFFIAIMPLEQYNLNPTFGLARLLGPVAMLGWFLDWRKRRYPLRYDSAIVMMTLFIFWGFASFFWTVSQSDSFRVFTTYLLLLPLYFMLINYIQTEQDLFPLMFALAIGGTLLVASGVSNMLSGGFAEYTSVRDRLTGLLDNPNKYVVAGILVLPAYFYLLRKGKLLGFLSTISVIAFIVTSLYTKSRGGLVSLAGFGLVLLMFRSTRGRNWGLVLLGLILVWQLAPPDLWARFNLIGTDRNDRISVLWPAGFELIRNNPIIGTGLGTNSISMGWYLGGATSVHSAPLAVAIELGLVGLVIYLGFMMFPVVDLWKMIRDETSSHSDLNIFAILIMAGLVGFLLTWVKGGAMEFNKMLWFDLGLVSGVAHLMRINASEAMIKEHGKTDSHFIAHRAA